MKLVGCCARCGCLSAAYGGSGTLTPVPAGTAMCFVPGPRGPAGWRVLGQHRWVPRDKVERICSRCLGQPVAPLPVPGPASLVQAAGFKRFLPTHRG